MRSAAISVVAAFTLLVTAGAYAEQRRRPAPPPPAPVAPPLLSTGGVTTLPPPPPPSPFAARPGTYAPRYNEPSRPRGPRGYSYGAPFYDSALGLGSYAPPSAPAAAPSPDQTAPAAVPAPEPPRAPEPIPEPPKIAALRGPDTFYVIPGCYAGNRPPNPGRLPKGCDVARLRTTPVR